MTPAELATYLRVERAAIVERLRQEEYVVAQGQERISLLKAKLADFDRQLSDATAEPGVAP